MTDPAPIIITHSDIANYLACKRKWGWSYVQDFQRPESRTGPLALGSRVHKAMTRLRERLGVPAGLDDRGVSPTGEVSA